MSATVDLLSDQLAGSPPGSLDEAGLDTSVRSLLETPNELIRFLVKNTLPDPNGDGEVQVDVMLGDVDRQLWFWNRAARRALDAGQKELAAEVWSALYLCFLSLQEQFQFRLHKGMALCNIGFACGKLSGKARDLQAKSWILGIIEDALTSGDAASDALNYRNLRSMKGVSVVVLDQLVATIIDRYLARGFRPLFPEYCVEAWKQAAHQPSTGCVRAVTNMTERLRQAYPNLPDSSSYLQDLRSMWAFLPWEKGVISE